MTQVNIISLAKRYPDQAAPVLDHFSLSVDSGELVALLGPSGSGKSTLLKLIAGIEQPDAGDVQFDGVSILNQSPGRRGAVFMFQKAYLFPFLSVEENIGFGLKIKGVSRSGIRHEVDKMLDLIGLPGIGKRKPAQLSGGEQQRVALARALVTHPRLLLLDEPLSSLDTEVRLTLQEAIRDIQRAMQLTTIFVTHDLGEAMAMSDRMAILLRGRVAALDRPERLFHYPPCVESARFVGVTLFLHGEAGSGWLDSAVGRVKIGDEKKTGRGVFAIRPEHIRLSRQPVENGVPGTIQGCVYRGEYMEYLLDFGGQTTRARLPLSAGMFGHGESLFVQLPVAHLFEVTE